MRAILVGELNPYGADPQYALFPYPVGSAGGRLCRLVLGLGTGVYMTSYHRVNLCDRVWSAAQAAKRAREIEYLDGGMVPVVLLGRKVQAAFGCGGDVFTRVGRFVVLPHPSGRCRIWNEPGAFERAREVLRQAGAL